MQVSEKHYKTISSMRYPCNYNFRSKTNNANLPLAASTFTAPDCDKPIARSSQTTNDNRQDQNPKMIDCDMIYIYETKEIN